MVLLVVESRAVLQQQLRPSALVSGLHHGGWLQLMDALQLRVQGIDLRADLRALPPVASA